jgi:hypothetical protein
VSRAWIALVDAEPHGADACAPVSELDGRAAGWLAAWRRRVKPLRDARRVDSRLVDPAGAAALVSLVRPPEGVRMPFDDLAVQEARRRVLAGPYCDGVSTLLSDATHFEGAISVVRGDESYDDPFARVFPARRLRVGAGVVGRLAPPAGPTIERYGSANPWPWDRFSAP